MSIEHSVDSYGDSHKEQKKLVVDRLLTGEGNGSGGLGKEGNDEVRALYRAGKYGRVCLRSRS